MRDLIGQISEDLGLTEEERAQTIPSGTLVIASRVHWAKTYLKKAGLLVQPKRSEVEISERGRQLLATNPSRIDPDLLSRFEEFRAFAAKGRDAEKTRLQPDKDASQVHAPGAFATPEDQIAVASRMINEALQEALLARVLEKPPAFFERLVIDLLLSMGYGGSRADAGEQLGRTGDGGVDGLIREDRLGLDRVYVQAKRYQPGNVVGSETVQAFIGALIGRGAQKGILITTSTFSKSARVASVQSGQLRLVLVDGGELMQLMIRFNVGVRVSSTVEIKRLDLDYFEEVEAE